MTHASPNPPAKTNFPATRAKIHSGEPGAKASGVNSNPQGRLHGSTVALPGEH